jgi:hypothetical protein
MSISRRAATSCLSLVKTHSQVNKYAIIRNYAAQAQAAAAVSDAKAKTSGDKKPNRAEQKAVESNSFAMNLFRGVLKPDEMFPYPSGITHSKKFEKILIDLILVGY